MRGLLRIGTGFKRHLLLAFTGIFLIILSFFIAFWTEFGIFFSTIFEQLIELANTRPAEFTIKVIIELAILTIGILMIVLGGKRSLRFFTRALFPEKEGKISHYLLKQGNRNAAPKIVVIGGGTGQYSVLNGMKEFTNNLTAIVTVADEGGSSRKLRYEFGMIPPGDIRNCIIALSDSSPLMAKLFQYRFDKGGIKGHSFGNLFLTALTKVTGSFEKAVEEAGEILSIRGKVVPVANKQLTLCAQLENGTIIVQEPNIESHQNKYKSPVKRLYFKEKNVKADSHAINAILKAEMIVIGPGSLFTSLLPNLIVPGIKEALQKTKAKKVYVSNIMTQPGETIGFSVSDHMKWIQKYVELDCVLVNKQKVPEEIFRQYKKEGSKPVIIDEEDIDIQLVSANLALKQNFARHDPIKLAKVLSEIQKA